MTKGPPTEEILESTRDLDRLGVEEILKVIHREDRRAVDAVAVVVPVIARAVDVLVGVLDAGGRWFNVGAGTSGRIGVLDAAELPPTFGTPPDRVQAIIAGGPAAFAHSVERAEDDAEAGASALREREIGPGDAVVALSASGGTPFALGALEFASDVGARTIAVTCNPDSPLARTAQIAIAPVVGPEVIAGSTRMKGGLVQKMVMHLLSTTVMVRCGCVEGNLMTRVSPASLKLQQRAVRIVMTLGGVSEDGARELLDACGGNVPRALERARS